MKIPNYEESTQDLDLVDVAVELPLGVGEGGVGVLQVDRLLPRVGELLLHLPLAPAIMGEHFVIYVQGSAKRWGCLLSYSQAEPGRELTQPSYRLLAEPCRSGRWMDCGTGQDRMMKCLY